MIQAKAIRRKDVELKHDVLRFCGKISTTIDHLELAENEFEGV